jgi:hypothetical protein
MTLADGGRPEAFDSFVSQLRGADESLRAWAIAGLEKLDTREARQALRDAGVERSHG